MKFQTSAPDFREYRKQYSLREAISHYTADKKQWDKFQSDLKAIKNNSPLKIKLGEPTKATDTATPQAPAIGAGVDFQSLTSSVSKALGINTGVQK